MVGIEVEAIEPEPYRRRHRGFNVWVNGRVVRSVQYEGEAHGLVARMKADLIDASLVKAHDVEADDPETDTIDHEDDAYSPGPTP